MKERLSGENINAYDEMINRSLERMKGIRLLIADLLDLTKIESEKKNKNFKKIVITDIANTSKEMFTPMAVQKNVTIGIQSDPEQIIFRADPEQVEIIFNNLISNAIKYNKDFGLITTSLNADHKEFEIVVKDTGIGIPEDSITKVFDRFYRVDKNRARDTGGSGLGLAIAQKTVLMHNGTLKCESVLDQGTEFTMRIPLTHIQ